jgi:repressor LexA
MEQLTRRQQDILSFIEQRLEEQSPPSQQEIAEHFGLAQNAIYQLVTYLKKKGYLESGRTHRGLRLSQEYIANKRLKGLPVVGRVAAGEPIFAEQNITDYMDFDGYIKKQHKDAFLLKIVGDSMINDGILNGDYVIVKPQATIENGRIGVVLLDDEATVKRIFIKADRLILKPANSRYKPQTFKRGDKSARIIGKVIGCFRTI